MLSGFLVTTAWRVLTLDGGDGLQIWRVSVNILNKQSWTDDGGVPPAWGLGVGLTTLHQKKKKACYEMSQRTLDLCRFLG
jgi:hypothetical protein